MGFLLFELLNDQQDVSSIKDNILRYTQDLISLRVLDIPNAFSKATVLFQDRDIPLSQATAYSYIADSETHIFVQGACYPDPQYSASIEPHVAYDIKSLKATLIPSLYNKGGIREIQKLQGDFNIIIYEARLNRVTCVSSQFGLLPMYYLSSDHGFYLSSSLTILAKVIGQPALNKAALAQLCLYNYSISDETLIANCHSLTPSSTLVYVGGELDVSQYWSPAQLLGRKIIRGKDAIELIDSTFDRVVKRFANQVDKCALSLTGGWDGRLVLSYLLQYMDSSDIQLYSFGTESSPDIQIPQSIASSMNLDYVPFILDQRYLESDFVRCARDTAINSDGYRSIQRAHYMYAMGRLSTKYTVVASGICGSNVMKTAANRPSVVFNRRIIDFLVSSEPERVLEQHYSELVGGLPQFFNSLTLDDFTQSIMSGLMKKVFQTTQFSERASMFIFSYLERKYFGAELASYQHIMANFSPFIDIGFIEALSQTEYFNAYKQAKGIFSNWGNSILYAQMMNRRNRELTNFASDKYVSLRDLLNPLIYPLVAVKQFYRRKLKPIAGRGSYYNTETTLNRFIEANQESLRAFRHLEVTDHNMIGSLLTAKYWYYCACN